MNCKCQNPEPHPLYAWNVCRYCLRTVEQFTKARSTLPIDEWKAMTDDDRKAARKNGIVPRSGL